MSDAIALPRYDRIFPLKRLRAYPGTGTLDMTFYLPPPPPEWPGALKFRVWLMTPAGLPEVSVDDLTLGVIHEPRSKPRWLNYGVAPLTTGFSQLRIRGMSVADAADSHLLVTPKPDFSPQGCTLEEAERWLWGLSRSDAGSTSITPARVPVAGPATFTVRYAAGPEGLPAGAVVRFAVPKLFSRPQTVSPARPGYIRRGNFDCLVRILAVEDSVESHERVDVFCATESDLHAGEGFELAYSTDETYLFPSRWDEADRPYWYSNQPVLAAAVATGPGRSMVSPSAAGTHSVEFVAGPAERLFLFLPGRRQGADGLTLRGVFTDHYRNVPPQGPVDAEFELTLENTGGATVPLGSPEGRFTALHRFDVPLPDLAPGVWRAVARRADGEVVSRSNPLEVMAAGDARDAVYWGEIHGHSEMSDGSGTYSGLYRHAREEGCLDFAAAADHACYHSDNEWLAMQDVTNAANDPGRFATLIGYEWAGRQSHRNLYTSRDRLDLFRGMYEPQRDIEVVWRHFHGDAEVVGGPHGVLSHGLVWEMHDPDVERFVEIYSMWGSGDRHDSPLAPDWSRDGTHGLAVHELLRRGEKLGFTGGGDCHEGHVGFSCEHPEAQGTRGHTFAPKLPYRCGLTAALLPALDRPALLHALRERRTYATTGARILVDFSAGGLPMGAEGEADATECRATVHAESPLARVEVIKDGECAWSQEADGLDAEIEWADPGALAGEHSYYLHVVQQDGQEAWSSPVWLSAAP